MSAEKELELLNKINDLEEENKKKDHLMKIKDEKLEEMVMKQSFKLIFLKSSFNLQFFY